MGNPQLIQFSREVIDLLKSQPSCIMPISKFIPSYHHHFAKQCRVSDYGYSKLLELLEAVPHVLQVCIRGVHFSLLICLVFGYLMYLVNSFLYSDLGYGYQTSPDSDPPCSSETFHPRPAQTPQISSKQTSGN